MRFVLKNVYFCGVKNCRDAARVETRHGTSLRNRHLNCRDAARRVSTEPRPKTKYIDRLWK